jgi:hypothetical protein
MPVDAFRAPLFTVALGRRSCGVAQFQSGKLARAELVTGGEPSSSLRSGVVMAREVVAWMGRWYVGGGILVVELPKRYETAKNQVSHEESEALHGVASAIVATCLERWKIAPTKTKHVYPRDWRGNQTERQCADTANAGLCDAERHVVTLSSSPDAALVLVAVGIGLSELGRYTHQRRS